MDHLLPSMGLVKGGKHATSTLGGWLGLKRATAYTLQVHPGVQAKQPPEIASDIHIQTGSRSHALARPPIFAPRLSF